MKSKKINLHNFDLIFKIDQLKNSNNYMYNDFQSFHIIFLIKDSKLFQKIVMDIFFLTSQY